MTILILLNPNHSGITELGPHRFAVPADGQPLQAEEVIMASGPDMATALRTAMYQLRVRREREAGDPTKLKEALTRRRDLV